MNHRYTGVPVILGLLTACLQGNEEETLAQTSASLCASGPQSYSSQASIVWSNTPGYHDGPASGSTYSPPHRPGAADCNAYLTLISSIADTGPGQGGGGFGGGSSYLKLKQVETVPASAITNSTDCNLSTIYMDVYGEDDTWTLLHPPTSGESCSWDTSTSTCNCQEVLWSLPPGQTRLQVQSRLVRGGQTYPVKVRYRNDY